MYESETHTNPFEELANNNITLSLEPETLDELLNTTFPPTRWIINGLIPSEGITIMSATPGSFKTWMLLDIAIKVSQGQKLFNHFETTQTGVLLVDEESGPRMLSERFKRLGSPKGLPISFFSRAGHKVTQDYIENLIAVCRFRGIGLVVFDSLVRIHQGDENTSKDMSLLFDLFRQLVDAGISVLIAHHNRKGVQGSYSPSDDMRGSSDILAAVDCHLALNRRKEDEHVEVRQTKNRYTKEVSPFKLRFTDEGEYSEFQFVEQMRSKTDMRDDYKTKILKALLEESGLTKKLLLEKLNRENVEIKNGLLGDLLDELKLDSLIDTKPGLRNAIHYFTNVEDQSGSATKTQ